MRYGFVILNFIFLSPVWSQSNLHFAGHYTTREGLSSDAIYCMVRDSRGFLWLGTKEGLNRFDGFQFKKYFSEKNNPHSLPHDNIFDILEYRSGQLLIGTSDGLSVLNTLNGQFENEKIGFAPLRAGSGAAINSMYKDKQANIWINHDGELDVLDSNLVYIYRFTDLDWAKNLKGVLIRFERWFTDQQGRLWLPSDTSGIHIVDFTAKKVYNSRYNPQQLPFLRSQPIRAFLNDEESHTLWYAPWGEGLIRYNFLTGELQQEFFGIYEKGESRTINSIIKTEAGNLLCNINGRFYGIDKATFKYKILQEELLFNHLDNNVTTYLAADQASTDQYWMGSYKGLYSLSGEKLPYKELSLIKAATREAECTDMIISRSGQLYCTYSNNLLVIVEKNRKDFAQYLIPGHSAINLTEVCEDKLNRIWIGSQQGIYLFDPVNNIFTRPEFLPDELLHLKINLIHCDRDGDIYITTRDPFGLYHYNVRNSQFQKVKNDVTAHFEARGESSRISAIVEDKQGDLWMSSRLGGGIIYYEKKKDRWKLFPPSGRNFNSLTNKGLACLYAQDNNFLWFSNYFGDGLIRYDYKNDSTRQFTRHDGLLGNYVMSIVEDNANKIWLFTDNGITRFNPSTLRVEHTISFPGLLTDDQQVVTDPLNTSMIVSLNDRLVFIPTDTSPSNHSFPQPLIDKITVNNQVQFIDPKNHQLSLSHDQKNISIDFTAVQLHNKGPIRFAYRLIGVDKDWKYSDANRTAQYSILPPGNYTFELKVSNESGVWNPDQAVFSFSIATLWWQTGWFRIAVILFIIGIVTLFFRKRVGAIRHEAEMKQRIAETEMMALRTQMNPHFIFNCLNSIDNLIQTNEKEKATTYLAKFAKLIRSILENSGNNVIPCWKDIETLKLYLELEELRWDNKFSYRLHVAPEIIQGDYKVPPMIIQPFVENAIHHGLLNKESSDKMLSIDITVSGNSIQYIIKDNGVGRAKAKEYKLLNKPLHQSMGMAITTSRIELFNQHKNGAIKITDLYDEQNQPSGTHVEVTLVNQS